MSYDDAGNRTKKVEDGVETEYTYNELNQLQSETTEGKETISYAYDTNGNLLCRGTTTEYETYTYTKANMLESVTSTTKAGETKEVYTYDAEGNRLSKTESKEVKEVDESTGEVTTTWEEIDKIYYVMDTSGSYSQVIAELDKDKKVKVLYTRGDGIISREEVGEDGTTSINFYLSDGHGDIRQLTDKAGKVTDSYRYNSYGELKETQGETDNPYLYTGEYYDEGTGLYYLRARYMNPETGTFTSMDTYRGNAYDPASLHRYTYAQNNPQMYNDPSGHSIGFISLAVNTICTEVVRNFDYLNVVGMFSGTVACLIAQKLGYEGDYGKLFIDSYLKGAGLAAAYIGACAIAAILELKMLFHIVMCKVMLDESFNNLVLALAYFVTGNHKEALIYASLGAMCLLAACAELCVSGIFKVIGPRGSLTIGTRNKNGNNYVQIEGKGSTGRTTPNDLIEEMAMDSTMKNPFDPGEGNSVRKIIDSLNDLRWKGWEKWEVVYRTDSGRRIIIHFSYDSINVLFDDFKFK